jgi:hypothetical protein
MRKHGHDRTTCPHCGKRGVAVSGSGPKARHIEKCGAKRRKTARAAGVEEQLPAVEGAASTAHRLRAAAAPAVSAPGPECPLDESGGDCYDESGAGYDGDDAVASGDAGVQVADGVEAEAAPAADDDLWWVEVERLSVTVGFGVAVLPSPPACIAPNAGGAAALPPLGQFKAPAMRLHFPAPPPDWRQLDVTGVCEKISARAVVKEAAGIPFFADVHCHRPRHCKVCGGRGGVTAESSKPGERSKLLTAIELDFAQYAREHGVPNTAVSYLSKYTPISRVVRPRKVGDAVQKRAASDDLFGDLAIPRQVTIDTSEWSIGVDSLTFTHNRILFLVLLLLYDKTA